MALQKQLIPLILPSLDQKADPRASVPGKLVTVENAYQQRSGEWRKREGITSRGTTTDSGVVTSAARLASNVSESMLLTDAALFSYSGASTAWRNSGSTVRTFSHGLRTIVSDAYDTVTPDCAYGSNILVTTWRNKGTNNGSFCYVITDSSGTPITGTNTVNTSSGSSRVLYYNGYFLFVWNNETSAVSETVNTKRLTASTRTLSGSVGTPITTSGTGAGSLYLDAAVRTDNGLAFIASVGASATALRWAQWNITTDALATASVAYSLGGAPGGIRAINVLEHDQSDGSIYVAVATSGTGVRLLKINATSLALTAEYAVDTSATDVRNVTGAVSGSNVYLWYERAASAAANNYIVAASITTGGASATTANFLYGCGLGSRTFTVNGQRCLVGLHKGAISTVAMLVGAPLSTPTACSAYYGRIAADRVNGLSDRFSAIPAVAAVSSTDSYFPIPTRVAVSASSSGTTFYSLAGVSGVSLSSGFTGIGRPLDTGRGTLIPGSLPRLYDGQMPNEAGFNVPPEAPTATAVAGGSLTLSATYQFVTVFAWYDAKGDLHRSATSPAVSFTPSGGNQTVQLASTGYWFGERFGVNTNRYPMLETYMTDANGTIFYKVASDVMLGTAYAISRNVNSFIGSSAEPLYTTGNVLDNVPPPPSKVFELHKNRVFAVNMDDQREVWPSKEFSAGKGISFSDSTPFRVDGSDGDVTALASMDDKLIIFKSQSIYMATGDGPDDLGSGSFDVQRIAIGVGTTLPMSVVSTPDGVMFKSDKGIYLLTRGLDVQYVGGPVEDFNSSTVVGAAVVPEKNQARFMLSTGTALVYDWYWSRVRGEPIWYTFIYPPTSVADCGIVGGRFALLTTAGVVAPDVSGQYNDDGSAINSKWVTNWLSFAQLAGWQRIYRVHVVGEYRGNHSLLVSFAYNGVSLTDESFVKDMTGVGFSSTTEEEYRWVMKPRNQQCTSIRVTVQDVPASGGTEGFRLSGLAFLAGIKPGAFRTHWNRVESPS